jgi:predicted Zn-dependent protease
MTHDGLITFIGQQANISAVLSHDSTKIHPMHGLRPVTSDALNFTVHSLMNQMACAQLAGT